MAQGLYVAFTHPRDDDSEDEFNRWYTDHHLPEILAVEGVTSAKRYKSTDPKSTHRYMATYTLDGDLPEIVARIHAGTGDRTPTTASRTDPGSRFELFEFIEEQHAP